MDRESGIIGGHGSWGLNNVAKETKYPAHGALRPHEGNFKAVRPNKTNSCARPQCRPRHQRQREYDLPMWRVRNQRFGNCGIQASARPRDKMQKVRQLS